jgi:hypothetical protein
VTQSEQKPWCQLGYWRAHGNLDSANTRKHIARRLCCRPAALGQNRLRKAKNIAIHHRQNQPTFAPHVRLSATICGLTASGQRIRYQGARINAKSWISSPRTTA